MSDVATVSARGAQRWARGHPWIFRSDVTRPPKTAAGSVRVRDDRGRWLGTALWSPKSEISLRMVDASPDATLDAPWWGARLEQAIERRAALLKETTACRLIHAEGDGFPALVCDRYDKWLVVQLLSAGVESFRDVIGQSLQRLTSCEGVLARNDVPLRAKEGLARETVVLHGVVPHEITVNEHGIMYVAAPWTGQKTGAFLDQRENRCLMGTLTRAGGRALDCFSYHGSFALHLARRSAEVTAIDSSVDALERATANARLNKLDNIVPVEANAFDFLRDAERSRKRYDTVILDPPAFAKNKVSLDAALRGYHEINLRAMRLLETGGLLYTASCSFHLAKPLFLQMIEHAAADSGRRLQIRALLGQPFDHPEIATIPETGYLKGVILEARD